MAGNFDPELFTLEDVSQAVATTHNLPIPAPPRMKQSIMEQVIALLKEGNPDKVDEYDHFGGAVAWGIAIGVIAERNRVARNS